MTVIPPVIAQDNIGTILCPGCGGIMRPVHWHYSDQEPVFTDTFLCTDCGEYLFDKENQECMTFPRNMREKKEC